MNATDTAELISNANKILVIQAENPDMDSLGSALGVESILGEMGKVVQLYCPVDIPRHLRYLEGWSRVTSEPQIDFDLSIVVDTSAATLLEKVTENSQLNQKISKKPVIVFDHHDNEPDLPWPETIYHVDSTAVAATQVVYNFAKQQGWKIDATAAEALAAGLLSDSLGFTSVKTTADSIHMLAELVEQGLNVSQLDEARRSVGKKSLDIIKFKGQLLQRIEYYLDNRFAITTVSLDEIKEYSDKYNPGMLVLEELRQAEGIEVGLVLKDYGDRITGKLRANTAMICDQIAGHFGGGGHPYAAGFKTSDWSIDELKKEVVKITQELLG